MKERTIKELLIILRDNLEMYFDKDPDNGGICGVILDLTRHNIISNNEWAILTKYLNDNKTRNAYKREKQYPDFFGGEFNLGRHWWKPRAVKPRINWLNKQIDKL